MSENEKIYKLIDEFDKLPLITWQEMVMQAYRAGYAAAQEWTPAETPPKHDNDVLICDENGYMGRGYYVKGPGSAAGWHAQGIVAAWRELPPPYQELQP